MMDGAEGVGPGKAAEPHNYYFHENYLYYRYSY